MLLFFEVKLSNLYFCSIFIDLKKIKNADRILLTAILWIATKLFDILMIYR